jgi:large subunit ribosomal protein L30
VVPGRLKVTQVKSTISHIARNRATVKALGLHGIGSSVEVVDNEATRGMVRQVRFLVNVEEIGGAGGDAVVAQASPGRGGAEHASERTPARKRARADASDGVGRMSADVEEKA